jgi:hypothetical protein
MTLEPDAQDDSTHTGDDKPEDQPVGGGAVSPISLGPPSPPQPPRTQPQAPYNPERWWQDRKYVLELCGFSVLFLYTIFAGLQWWHIRWTNHMTREALDGNSSALQQTLDRMVWQIKETHEIAKQTLTQAQETQKLATDTHTLAEQAKVQARAAQEMAKNTAGQLDIMQTQMELVERPRVSIDVSIAGDMTFGENYLTGKKKISIPLKFTYRNGGPTPALLIVSFHKLAPDNYAYMSGSKNHEGQAKSVRDVCLEHTDIWKTSGEIPAGGENSGISPVEGDINPERNISPIVSTCISYRSNFGKRVYHSEASYWIDMKDGTLPIPGKAIPQNLLRLEVIGNDKRSDDNEK